MVISIKGINTGVIRQNNEFIALALKIKEPRNKTSLFFLSPLGLRDLLIALESRLIIIIPAATLLLQSNTPNRSRQIAIIHGEWHPDIYDYSDRPRHH